MKKLLLLLLMTSDQLKAQTIRVAVAANAQFVMERLKSTFETQSGIKLETVISSSGKITTQIQQGAPFDVFLSADMYYPGELYKGGFALEPPKTYAYGTLVVWTLGSQKLTKDLQLLTTRAVKKIAIANPKLAPYGQAAEEALRHYGLDGKIKDKLVFGESISQVNQYILSQVAEVGFTAKSVVLDPSLKEKGNWVEVDSKVYSPIAQGVILIKNKGDQSDANARKFYDFLFSPKAQAIFKEFGYRVIQTGSPK